MRNDDIHHSPVHKSFGRFLKTMRQRMQESLGETSGAVEIGVEQLDRYERGTELPTEDILMLLISHFNLHDDEAVRLWELAGYDRRSRYFDEDQGRGDRPSTEETPRHAMQVMLLAIDSRILYTNGAEIMTDETGVVLSFTQAESNNHAPIAVSKIGMSYEQAEQVMSILQRAILHKKYLSGPKQLPPQVS